MNLQLRPYQPSDKEACLSAFKSNVPRYFTEEEIFDFESFLYRIETRDSIAQSPKQTHYYVISVNGLVVGCGGFGDKDNTREITLAWGLIHKDFHKKGFGAVLLKFRLQEIKKLYPAVPLVIDTTQYSYSFFEKFGFVTTKITKNFYAPGMHRYYMKLQKKQLP